LHDASLTEHVYSPAIDHDNILQTDPIYIYHPSAIQDAQSPLALTLISPAHSPNLIENQCVTGLHSTNDPNVSTYVIFVYLSHDASYKDTTKTLITAQLSGMQKEGLPKGSKRCKAWRIQSTRSNPNWMTNQSQVQLR
jgi:hypothetical protein